MSDSDNSIPDELLETETKIFQQPVAEVDCEFSKRFVVSKLDWDRVNSVDLFVLANSFTPVQFKLKSVSIHQSNYGRQVLEKEQQNGPDLHRFHDEAFKNELSANLQALKVYKQLKQENQQNIDE